MLYRKQKVVTSEMESKFEKINLFDVPQCSILGPLLFLMFINDLPLYTENVFTDLYADATMIYTKTNC